MGTKSPSWLGTTPALQMLRTIELENCRNWSRLPSSIGLFLPFLEDLSLNGMQNITFEGDDTAPIIFPSLKKLKLYDLESVSFEGMSLSSSSSSTMQPGGRKLFPLLEKLKVEYCDVVNGLPWPMLSQLSELDISDSPGLDAQLPGCLKGLKSLTILWIYRSECEILFDREVMATLERLKEVTVKDCNELISVDGLQVLPSLEYLSKGVLLPNLSNLYIEDCEDMESLPPWLPLLPSLENLVISNCPKLGSLPESRLPSSLRKFVINRCDPGLMECCKQMLLSNPEWQMIREGEYIIFERKRMGRNDEVDLSP